MGKRPGQFQTQFHYSSKRRSPKTDRCHWSPTQKTTRGKRRKRRNCCSAAAAQEPKKKRGACFICSDPDHYAPDCPNKPEKKPAGTYKPPNAYYQKGASNTSNAYYQKGASNGYQKSPYFHQSGKPKQDGPTIAERKQNSTCYQCGQQGHWAAECPIKDIPEYDQEFWQDVDSMVKEELGSEYQEPDPLPTPPAPVLPTPATAPAPKKRKLSLKKKDQQWFHGLVDKLLPFWTCVKQTF